MLATTTPEARAPSIPARLMADLRHAERNWQMNAAYDNWPGGNPWADLRDAWAARYDRIKAEIEGRAA